jgi:hypothetical protein
MIAIVSFSTFLVVRSKYGVNIILEGLMRKLDTLKKASAFALAQMDVYEKEVLPKALGKYVEEMKEFVRRK